MVNDVKHDLHEPDTNAHIHVRGCFFVFLLSFTFVVFLLKMSSSLTNEPREEIKLTSIMHLPENRFVVLLFPLFLQMRAICYPLCICVCVHVQHGRLCSDLLTPKCVHACIYSVSITVHACLCECV